MRRALSIDALIPALYLKGISTGNMSEDLVAILGDHAQRIISNKRWWQDRDLSSKEYYLLLG